MKLSPNHYDKLKKLFVQHLELDSRINPEEVDQDSVAEWTSAKHLSLIMEIEAGFGIAFQIEEVVKMRSFIDIVECLSNKL